MKNQISPHDTCNSATGPDGGYIGMKIEKKMGKTRCNAAQQVKNKIPKRTQTIFDVIAKNVKGPHVAQKMPEPAVKKHEREPRQKLLTGGKIR